MTLAGVLAWLSGLLGGRLDHLAAWLLLRDTTSTPALIPLTVALVPLEPLPPYFSPACDTAIDTIPPYRIVGRRLATTSDCRRAH